MSQHFGKYSISSYLKLDNNEMINMIVIFSKQHWGFIKTYLTIFGHGKAQYTPHGG